MLDLVQFLNTVSPAVPVRDERALPDAMTLRCDWFRVLLKNRIPLPTLIISDYSSSPAKRTGRFWSSITWTGPLRIDRAQAIGVSSAER